MPSPTKVMMIIPTLDRSGAEKQLTLLATQLPREEFAVEVVALTRGGPYAEELAQQKVPLTILHKRGKIDISAMRRLQKLIRDRQPEIIHTWLFAANSYGRWAAGQSSNVKVIVSERCVDVWKSSWQRWIDRRLIPQTDRLVGNSPAVAEYYRQLGYPSDRLSVIQNGIDVPAPFADNARQQILSELGLASGQRIIACIGRLAPQKRLRDLIWAFELLRQIVPDLKFLIVGDGPDRASLEQFSRDLRCDSDIIFLGHRDDVARLWGGVDLFWLASDFEGQSNSVMEAMAAGIPVVVSDIPPNRELVVDRETGVIVPVGDSASFVRESRVLFENRELATKLGNAARLRMQQHFSVKKMVDGYAALYREVMKE